MASKILLTITAAIALTSLYSKLSFAAGKNEDPKTKKAAPVDSKSSLPPVKDKVVLTVTGASLTNKNKDATAQFDMAGLTSLGTVKIKTSTPWFKDKVEFEGVPLKALLEKVGAKGTKLILVALNDYKVEMPLEDAHKHNVIIALKRDGKFMPVSDKGPLFVVYEFDAKPELQQKLYYGRSAWQLARIDVQ